MAPASPTGPRTRRPIRSQNVSSQAVDRRVNRDRSESADEEDRSAESDIDSDSPIRRGLIYEQTRRTTVNETIRIINRQISQSPSRPREIRGTTQSKRLTTTTTRVGVRNARVGISKGLSNRLSTPVLLFALSIILALLCYAIFKFKAPVPERQRKFCNEFDNLKKLFPRQSSYLWRALKAGIEGTLNNEPPSPSIFLFLHQNHYSNLKLISNIVNATAGCFDPSLKAVTLSGDFFASHRVTEDHGVAIVRYKDDLKDGGVLLITDLNKIPAQGAQALHFICDNINPPVRETVIFLTLVPSSDIGNLVEIAEDTLKMLWGSTLDDNILAPLITRITDQVIRLLPE